MNADDIPHLLDLLRRMQQNDPEFRVFGSTTHKYRLGPPLREEALLVFEQQYQVRLPDDYRFFLNKVGNGGGRRGPITYVACNAGAGPDYGIFPLEEAVAGCDPTLPFPLVSSASGQPIQGNPDWGDTEPWPGVLEISYSGCAFFSYLVVNGPAYGTVWNADVDLMNFFPTGLSFEAWYRRWLDRLIERALPQLAHERVVAQVSLGMTKAQVIRICGGRWKLSEIGKELRFLRFEPLSTAFQLDESDRVARIVRHDISLGM